MITRLTQKQVEDYFQELVDNHPDLKYMTTIIISGEPFPKEYLKEYIDSLRSKIKYPALVLQSYEGGYSDNNADNWTKSADIGFIILDKPHPNTPENRSIAQENTEFIGEDLLKTIIEESKTDTAIASGWVGINDFTHEPIQIDKTFGTRFDITFNWAVNLYFR